MQVRLTTYKSYRHYGGRVITETQHVCKAEFICVQSDGSYLVTLSEDCAGFKIGHKIALIEKDFDIENKRVNN